MGVLAASIIKKSGKVLMARQYVDMSRIRIEGLLAAFPKLVGIGKQHTFVETDRVRYVYQPIDLVYLVVLTNKQSNILEDLETLRILSKLVPEYAPCVDEEEILYNGLDLVFAFDEVISLGRREKVTISQVRQYCEMESQEEKLHKMMLQSKINETKDIMKLRANEIDKSKVDRSRSIKGSFMSLQSMSTGGFEGNLSDLSISSRGSGFGSGTGNSGLGLGTDVDSLITSKPNAASVPSKGLAMQLGKNQRTNKFLQSLKAEGEEIVEEVRPSSFKSIVAASPVTNPVTLNLEEKLNVTLKRDGGLANFDVQGTLSLQIMNEEDAYIHVQVESKDDPSVLFKTHPNINKELFSRENILGLKDPDRPFPTDQLGAGVGLLKWRMQSMDESVVPLTISCWPSVSGDETDVSIEYEASSMFDLKNVIISVPFPSLREAPNVRQIDGEWRYEQRNSTFEWSILLIDDSNRRGSVEFAVPATDPSVFFPILVRFTATDTFSGLKVANVIPLKGDSPPKYAQRTQLCTENYRVV